MIADALAFLQSSYASCSDDDWEHSYGVTIETLDNPGCHLKIDLVDTPLAGASLDRLEVERAEDDWVHAWSDGLRFEGACGPPNLGEMMGAFRDFAKPEVDARAGGHGRRSWPWSLTSVRRYCGCWRSSPVRPAD
ncbi:immunity 53 family protein [Nonomuraea indica]|uniref:Immunity 53 family protein n=1 Tax=Nonomuraea indica TaxID=1581193 RepID=A0ABW7ZWD9_9ACTN